MKWEYYGREGADGKYTELYRMPSHLNGIEKFAAKQRLRKDLSWTEVPGDNGLSNDWATGWFDFEDNRLTEEQVKKIVDDWINRNVWPGRP